MSLKKEPIFSIYKPLKKADAGAALQLKYSFASKAVFVEAARQKGEKLSVGDKNQFDWDNKITMKLGLVDIGQLLLVGNKKQEVDLVHQSEKEVDGKKNIKTSILKFKKQTGEYDNYALRLTKMEEIDGTKNQPFNVQIYIDHHEMMIINVLFRKALEKMLGF